MISNNYNQDNPSNYDLAIGFLQVFDLLLNVSQSSNDDIMKELQHQNSDYLGKILNEISGLKSSINAVFRQNDLIMTQNAEILRRLDYEKDVNRNEI